MPIILKDSYAIPRIVDGHLRLWLNFLDGVARCTLSLQLSAGIILERKHLFSSATALVDSLAGSEKLSKPLRQTLINWYSLSRPWCSFGLKKLRFSWVNCIHYCTALKRRSCFPALPKFLEKWMDCPSPQMARVWTVSKTVWLWTLSVRIQTMLCVPERKLNFLWVTPKIYFVINGDAREKEVRGCFAVVVLQLTAVYGNCHLP